MAQRSKAILRTLHRAIKKGATQGHILEGHVTEKDMDVLKKHLDAGTLMRGITPIASAPSRAAAVRDMPKDLGAVIAKIPATTVRELGTHLNTLGRDANEAVPCDC